MGEFIRFDNNKKEIKRNGICLVRDSSITCGFILGMHVSGEYIQIVDQMYKFGINVDSQVIPHEKKRINFTKFNLPYGWQIVISGKRNIYYIIDEDKMIHFQIFIKLRRFGNNKINIIYIQHPYKYI